MTEWDAELAELERRRELAARRGGKEGVDRQRRRGKLLVTERIDLLADSGSFRQFGGLKGQATYGAEGELKDFVPDGQVDGMCTVDGRKVVVMGGDFTVRGGSATGMSGGLGQELSAAERAGEWRLPYIRLLDSAGGSVRSFEELGRTYLPDANVWTKHDVRLLSLVPVVSAVLGSVAGLPALHATLAHFNVMTRENAQVFPGGPPVVKAATGVDIAKEDLGGPDVHTRISGVVDNLAEDEADAVRQIRRFLSYLPSSVFEVAPRREPCDPAPDSIDLANAIPRSTRQPFRAREIIRAVVDEDSFFELSPDFGRSRVTGLARVDGYPVAVMINDPMQLGGATDVSAGQKVARLIQLCDTFHLPLLDFADEPGLMVGLNSEQQGIERAGARLICTVVDSRMPWLVFAIRRLYGVGGQTHHRASGMFRRYAWPSASWGSMHILGGAAAAYRRDIESAPDPDAKQREIEAMLLRIASPFRTAEATGQDIIDPRDSRALAMEFVHDAQRVLAEQVGPPHRSYLP